ncbi:MAG: imidazole glycerol phosphate synthase subunit HisH [Pirellulaceae bacterium]|nr:imidazole glycerol phosphate synthase subunit HisH [Pirellulaceae bacterium]
MKVGIFSVGGGNLASVQNALRYLEVQYTLVTDDSHLDGVSHFILPGVGAFGAAAERLRLAGVPEVIQEHVNRKGKPLLGICLGMQLLASTSSEFGLHNGLNLIPGKVVPITGPRSQHMGWNQVAFQTPSRLFAGLPDQTDFYFVHGYHVLPETMRVVTAVSDFGSTITSAIEDGNIFGVQFHPEKSQQAGLLLLRNFVEV